MRIRKTSARSMKPFARKRPQTSLQKMKIRVLKNQNTKPREMRIPCKRFSRFEKSYANMSVPPENDTTRRQAARGARLISPTK
jgi:hypothetical protein